MPILINEIYYGVITEILGDEFEVTYEVNGEPFKIIYNTNKFKDKNFDIKEGDAIKSVCSIEIMKG
jgi:hypothetical protein